MTTRPQPRSSALAGLSPTSPASPTRNAGKAGNASFSGNSSKAATTKITITLATELSEEARGAFWATGFLTEKRSFSEWVAAAIEMKLNHDRREFNNGKPFTELAPGIIPTGKPCK